MSRKELFQDNNPDTQKEVSSIPVDFFLVFPPLRL
jgi:hypothetical protein